MCLFMISAERGRFCLFLQFSTEIWLNEQNIKPLFLNFRIGNLNQLAHLNSGNGPGHWLCLDFGMGLELFSNLYSWDRTQISQYSWGIGTWISSCSWLFWLGLELVSVPDFWSNIARYSWILRAELESASVLEFRDRDLSSSFVYIVFWWKVRKFGIAKIKYQKATGRFVATIRDLFRGKELTLARWKYISDWWWGLVCIRALVVVSA